MSDTFARNSAFSAAAGLSTTLGGVLSSVIVARLLGVEGTGVVAFATWVATVAILLADLGVPGALARYLPELHARGATDEAAGLARFLFWPFLAAVFAISLALGAYGLWLWHGASGGGLWLRPGDVHTQPLFWLVVGLSTFTQGIANYFIGYLRGMQDFGRMARLALLSGLLHLGFTYAGGISFGIAGALTGSIAASVLPAVLAVSAVSRHGAITPALRRRVVRFAWGSWAYYLVTVFAWSRMEIFFLERSWGSESVGLFAVALTLANLATQGPLLLTGALMPYFSQHSVASLDKAQEAYAVGLRLVALIVMPACLGLAAIAPTLVPLIYGEDFAKAVPSVGILLGAAAFSGTASVAVTYLLAMERTRFAFLVGGAGAVLSIVVGLTVIPAFGPVAAAVGRGAIQVLTAAAIVWYIVHRLQCPTPFAALGRLLLAAILAALTAGLCQHLIAGPAALVPAILAGALVYGLAVRLFGALPRSDVDRLVAATAILPQPLRPAAAAVLRFLSNEGDADHGAVTIASCGALAGAAHADRLEDRIG